MAKKKHIAPWHYDAGLERNIKIPLEEKPERVLSDLKSCWCC